MWFACQLDGKFSINDHIFRCCEHVVNFLPKYKKYSDLHFSYNFYWTKVRSFSFQYKLTHLILEWYCRWKWSLVKNFEAGLWSRFWSWSLWIWSFGSGTLGAPNENLKPLFSDQIYPQSVGKMVSEKPILATLKWFSHPCTFFFSKSSNGPILKFWILKVLCDMYPKMWNITLEHFSSLDASSSYMCYECNFSSKSTCNLKQHLLNLKQSHFIPF